MKKSVILFVFFVCSISSVSAALDDATLNLIKNVYLIKRDIMENYIPIRVFNKQISTVKVKIWRKSSYMGKTYKATEAPTYEKTAYYKDGLLCQVDFGNTRVILNPNGQIELYEIDSGATVAITYLDIIDRSYHKDDIYSNYRRAGSLYKYKLENYIYYGNKKYYYANNIGNIKCIMERTPFLYIEHKDRFKLDCLYAEPSSDYKSYKFGYYYSEITKSQVVKEGGFSLWKSLSDGIKARYDKNLKTHIRKLLSCDKGKRGYKYHKKWFVVNEAGLLTTTDWITCFSENGWSTDKYIIEYKCYR